MYRERLREYIHIACINDLNHDYKTEQSTRLCRLIKQTLHPLYHLFRGSKPFFFILIGVLIWSIRKYNKDHQHRKAQVYIVKAYDCCVLLPVVFCGTVQGISMPITSAVLWQTFRNHYSIFFCL